MALVYLIDHGCYSDRSTDGIFSSEDRALDWIRAQPWGYESFSVYAWELDPPHEAKSSWPMLHRYGVRHRDGVAYDTIQLSRDSHEQPPDGYTIRWSDSPENAAEHVLFDWRVKRANDARVRAPEDE